MGVQHRSVGLVMSSAQGKLAAALRKQSDDEPRPPSSVSEPDATQAPPIEQTMVRTRATTMNGGCCVQDGRLKLRKSNLLGIITWDEMLAQECTQFRKPHTKSEANHLLVTHSAHFLASAV